MAAILDFSKMVKIIKMAFEHLHIALAVKIEIRFALRLTVSKIMAIEVSAVVAILDFLKHLKMAKMAFGILLITLGVKIVLLHIAPWG